MPERTTVTPADFFELARRRLVMIAMSSCNSWDPSSTSRSVASHIRPACSRDTANRSTSGDSLAPLHFGGQVEVPLAGQVIEPDDGRDLRLGVAARG